MITFLSALYTGSRYFTDYCLCLVFTGACLLTSCSTVAPPPTITVASPPPASPQSRPPKLNEYKHGVPQGTSEYVTWLHQEAEQGDTNAQFLVGKMYQDGNGVPQHYSKALAWYRKAASQGNTSAQMGLGSMHLEGLGVSQDYGQGAMWVHKAASQGDPLAQTFLAALYEEGKAVPRNYTEAAKWYRKAADQGEVYAQNNLGAMYVEGRGIPQDFMQAYLWLNLAVSRLPPGEIHDRTAKARDIIAARLTPAQLAEAQRLAREWKPKPPYTRSPLVALPHCWQRDEKDARQLDGFRWIDVVYHQCRGEQDHGKDCLL